MGWHFLLVSIFFLSQIFRNKITPKKFLRVGSSIEMDIFKRTRNYFWYRYTVFMNSGGDLAQWIDDTDEDDLKFCKALVRREDSLIFQDSISCFKCSTEYATRYVHRAHQDGGFLRGKTIFGIGYDKHGRYKTWAT